MQTLIVNLSDRSYPIHVGAEIIERAGQLMQQAGLLGKVAIVTNPTVAQLYLDPIHGALSQAGFETTPVLLPIRPPKTCLKRWEDRRAVAVAVAASEEGAGDGGEMHTSLLMTGSITIFRPKANSLFQSL